MFSDNPKEQLYFLQFKFLPKLCELYEEDKINKTSAFDESKLTNKDLMSSQPLFNAIDWGQIKIEKKELPDKIIEFIYDFGEPSEEPFCRFSVFYIDQENEAYEYFTLEKIKEYKKFPYIICNVKNGKHNNYGIECQPDLATFEGIVKDQVKKQMKVFDEILKLYLGNNSMEHHEYYEFEFKFLPKLFDIYEKQKRENPDKELNEDNLLVNVENIKNIAKFQCIDWTKFKFEKKILPNNAKEFIYDFGEPKNHPLCRFGIYYVDHLNGIFEYITLEKTTMYTHFPYYVCGQKGPQHKNYGLECSGDLETFEKVVQQIIEKQIKPSTGFNSETLTLNVGK